MSNSIPPEEMTKPVNGQDFPFPSTEKPAIDVPEQLQDLIESIGSSTNINVSIWRMVELSQKWSLVSQGSRLLGIDEIGKRFGGGEYRMKAVWRAQGERLGRPRTRELEFVIGPEYDHYNPLNRKYEGHEPAQPDLDKVLGLAERIATIRGGGNDGAGIVSLVEKMIDRMDRMQERSDAKFEKLIETIGRQKHEAVNPTESLREIMAFGKEMGIPMLGNSNENSREPWLEIADMVANNVGKFLEMMAASQKSNLARVRMMADPMARKVATVGAREMQNPESRAKMIAHLDAKVGPEKTNQILEGLGVKR